MTPTESITEAPAIIGGEAAPVAYDIEGAKRAAGTGRTPLIEAMDRGELPARKLGRRTVILHDDLMTWLRSLPARQPYARGGKPRVRQPSHETAQAHAA